MIDNVIVLIYLISILCIGLYYRSRAKSLKSYGSMNSSGHTSTLLLVATIFATAVGGGTIFGISEKAFANNIVYSYALILTVPVDILIGIYLVPRITKHYGAVSMGDIMEKFYGKQGRIIVGIGAVLISVGYLAAQVNVSGRIFQYILDIDRTEGVILSYVIVIIYTTIGGLSSVVFANLIQFLAMIATLPIITFVGLYYVGIQNFIVAVPLEKYDITQFDILKSTILISLSFSVMGFYPSFIQRTLMSKDSKSITNAILIKSTIYVFFLICVTINGLLAFVMDNTQSASLAIPYMIDNIIPIGIKGFVVVGLLSAVMSTADSDLNIASISIVKDIFVPLSHSSDQEKLILYARIVTVVIGSLSILLALRFHSVVDLVIFAAGFWAPMVLVPFVAALFDIVVSKKDFIITSLIGIVSFILWEYFSVIPELKGVFVGTMCSAIYFCIARARNSENFRQQATKL